MNQYKFIPEERHYLVSKMLNDLIRLGFNFTPLEVYNVWDQHSDDLCAGWLIHNDEELIRVFSNYGIREHE